MTLNIKSTRKLLIPLSLLLPFFLGFQSGGFQLALLNIASDFKLNNASMGTLVSAQYCASVAGPLLLGRFVDKLGKKSITIISSLLFILGCFTLIWTTTILAFMLGIFILGMGFSVCQGSMSAALSDAYPGKAAKYINLAQCFYSLGAVVSPLLVSFAMTNLGFGWNIVFSISGIGYCLLFIPLLCTKFTKPPVFEAHEHKGFRKLFSSGRFLCLLFAIVLYVSFEGGLLFFLNSMFSSELHAPQMSAMAISIFWLAMVPSRFLGGILHSHKVRLIILGFGGGAVFLFLFTFSTNAILAISYCCILGLFFGPIWPTLVGLATEEAPANTGSVTSIMMAASGLGGAISPVIMGGLADSISIRASYVMLGLMALIGLVLILAFHYKSKVVGNS